MLFALNLIASFINKKSEHLWYGLYTLSLAIFLTRGTFSLSQVVNEPGFFDAFIQYFLTEATFMFIFYFLFLRAFIDAPIKYPKLNKFLIGIVVVSFVCMICYYLLHLFSSEHAVQVYNCYRIFIVILTTIATMIMVRYIFEDTNVFITFMGAIPLLLGHVLSLIFGMTDIFLFSIPPIFWMIFGTFGELIIFSSGILYKGYKAENDKDLFKSSLIKEMKRNEVLINTKRTDLEKQVAVISESIEKEVEDKLKAQYKLKSQELELQLLRSQMNPHFLFNSMNSLKRYILENETEQAADYLDSFAILFRQMIDNTKQQFVLLESEIQFLTEYLRLESMRLDNSIEYLFDVSEEIDESIITIPSMLLQPIIENAVWHGLSTSNKERKYVHVHFYRNEDKLVIEVKDNGVGIIPNAKSTKKGRTHSSDITKERLMRMYDGAFTFEVIPQNKNDHSEGTITHISIPMN